MNSLLSASFKLGGDASVAAGPVGAGVKSDIVADFITFSRAKGIYGGLNLDGTVINASDDWNELYYQKKPLTTSDILIRVTATNPQANKLLAELASGTGGGGDPCSVDTCRCANRECKKECCKH